MVLDGELVVGGGRLSDLYALSGRLNVRKPTAENARVAFMAFDLLWLDDRATIGETDLARRELLEGLALDGDCGVIPRYPAEDLDALLAASEREGMEGVVVKLDRSLYRPGARSKAWAKVKCSAWAEHLERRRLTMPRSSTCSAGSTRRQLALLMEFPTVLNLARLLLPLSETVLMHTTAMSATMRAYSTIVAPSSPDRRCIRDVM